MRCALIILANACHSRVHRLAAVLILHGLLAKEEHDVAVVLQRVNERRLIQDVVSEVSAERLRGQTGVAV